MKTWRGNRLTGAELFLIGLAVLVLLLDAFMLIMTVIVTLAPNLRAQRAHASVSPGQAWQACLIIGTLSACYIRMVLRHLDQRCC